MSQVVLQGYITVPESDLSMVLSELDRHCQLTLQEAGCLEFKVIQNPDNACRFDVYEVFTDQASFEQHQQRVKTSTWGKVSMNACRHYQITSGNG